MGRLGLGFRGGGEEGRDRVETVVGGCRARGGGGDELNLALLKEARVFYFNSDIFTCPSMIPTLFRAITFFKRFGGHVFFDLNLALPFWRCRHETKEILAKALEQADIIRVSRQELEFLLDEEYYLNKRSYKAQYYAEDYHHSKDRKDHYHYMPEELAPLWQDKMKFLFVTDGTLRIHYYSPNFDGVVVGTEDVLITPYTCDRTGSGDAIVAAMIRKLISHPEMFHDKDVLERQLRFAVAAGIIAQWTIGAVRGLPTESAAQNLKEQVYIPPLW
ncbi:Fructokinase-like 1, chloroplastic-like protein [Drosera capensis]